MGIKLSFKAIFGLFLSIILLSVMIVGVQKVYGKFVYRTKLEEKLSQDKILTFLINVYNEEEVSVSVFVFLQPLQKKCGLFFINPISTFDDKKIETMGKDALLYLLPKIESITSLKVNFYLNLKRETVSEIVDLFDGLPFYLDSYSILPSDKYRRITGNFLLSGEETLDITDIVRQDDPLTYINRLNLQESLALSFYDRMKSKQDIRKEWLDQINKKIDSNLDGTDFNSIYNYIKNNNIIFSVAELPGELVHDEDKKILKLIIHEENASFGFSKLAAYLSSGDYNIGDLARTEVLNSTETNGLAKSVKSIINESGIKVLTVGNGWNAKEKKSIIIDRSGSTEYSYKISKILGIKNVHHLINKETGLDTTILLGEDFEIKSGK